MSANDETTQIPPVPATPPGGMSREEISELERRASEALPMPVTRIGPESGYPGSIWDGEAAVSGQQGDQGQPPARRTRHPQRSAGWGTLAIYALLLTAVAFLGLVAYDWTEDKLDRAYTRAVTITTRTEMDWIVAHSDDYNIRLICQHYADPKLRTEAVDRLYAAATANSSSAVPARPQVEQYVKDMCAADGWGRVK